MNDDARTLIDLEKRTLVAFEQKDEKAFTAHFGRDYVGIANDAIKGAEDEVKGMMKLDLSELHLEHERVFFPTPGVGVITYDMIAEGTADGKPMAATIFVSTVYVRRNDRWEAVLHTESMKSPA